MGSFGATGESGFAVGGNKNREDPSEEKRNSINLPIDNQIYYRNPVRRSGMQQRRSLKHASILIEQPICHNACSYHQYPSPNPPQVRPLHPYAPPAVVGSRTPFYRSFQGQEPEVQPERSGCSVPGAAP
jgi:hypothetical protein